MTIKSTKYLALALAIVMIILTAYTLDVGVRIWSYTSRVGYAQQYYSCEYADKVYNEISVMREKLVNESAFASFLYYSSNFVRLLVFVIEVVSVYLSITLYRVLVLLEELEQKKKLKFQRKVKKTGEGK